MWRIKDWDEKMQLAKSSPETHKRIFCKPFYTSPSGYKMTSVLYPNGDGVGLNTHVSIYVVILSGEYDDILSWPCRIVASIQVYDTPGKHITHDIPGEIKWTKPENGNRLQIRGVVFCIPHSKLMKGASTTLVKKDVLFIKIKIRQLEEHGMLF
jgi:hypothetical protein